MATNEYDRLITQLILIRLGKMLCIAVPILVLFVFAYNHYKSDIIVDEERHPVIIWNDDLESLPMENTEILLEMYSKNSDTIYIGPKA